jgi:cytoskeleton protein RodZ
MQQAMQDSASEPPQSTEPASAQQGEQPASATIGSVLAAARVAQGLEIADVARSLKLSAKQVEALETDDFASMRGNTFVRGFIRNYAKLLRVDPAPLLDSFQQGAPAEDHALSAASQQIALPVASGRRRLVYIGVAAIAVIAAPILIYESLRGEREPAPPAVQSAAPALAARPEVAEPRVIQPVVPPVVETQPAAALPEVPPVAVPVPAVAPPEAVKPAMPLTPAASVPQLRLVFEQTSWVEIRDGRGKVVLSELNQGGSERLVEGRPPFSLVVGNAAHVRIDYNGKPVDLLPHTQSDVARLTLK